MLKNYIKIAFKVLLRKKLYSFITMTSIALTLTIIMIIIAIASHIHANYMRNNENEKLLLLSSLRYEGNSMAIMPPSYYFVNDFNDKSELSKKVGCVSFINTPIDYYKNEKRNSLNLRYTDNYFWEIMKIKFIEGRPFYEKELKMGERVAVIDEKTKNLIFGDEKAYGKSFELQGQNVLVTGVVENIDRLNFLYYGNIWMPITLMEGINNRESKGQVIAITTYRNNRDIDYINTELHNYLSMMDLPQWHTNVNGSFEKGAWAVFGNAFDISNIKYVAGIVIFILILLYLTMPVFNLYALFGMRLTERASEIGLRKSFGAARKTIRNQFIVENLFIVLLGSLVAFILTTIALNLINYLQIIDNSNLQINLNAFLISLLVSILFGLMAGYMPSVRISKKTIIETLNNKAND